MKYRLTTYFLIKLPTFLPKIIKIGCCTSEVIASQSSVIFGSQCTLSHTDGLLD